MRLFIAIELPPEIKRTLWMLRSDLPGARWVPREQMHLTLAFLGEVEDEAVGVLRAELARIHFHAFKVSFTSTGCFPGRQRPRVLWVGLAPQPRLTELAALVREALLRCNLPVEERPFSPHITLARLKAPAAREVGVFLEQSLPPHLPMLVVQEFILFQSRLTPRGAEHLPLSSFSLAPG